MGAMAWLISDYINDGHRKAFMSVLLFTLLPLTLVLVSGTGGSPQVSVGLTWPDLMGTFNWEFLKLIT